MRHPVSWALMVGNALACYDFLLYSLFVSILSPLFFPSTDSLTALMGGFGVFAVGFAARPLGAVIFGHLGDNHGRKIALLGTLLLMAFSTIGIGFLPTYEKIGALAPFFLVILRFIQGFAAGGETSGAAILGLEQAPETQGGFIGSLIRASTSVGAIGATMMGLVFINDYMPGWTWRIPFFLGGVIGLIGLYLRRTLNETVNYKPLKMPLLNVIQKHPLSFLKTIGIGGFLHVPFYSIAGYMNPILHTKGVINSFQLMLMNMIVTLCLALLLPFMGRYSDKVCKHQMMLWGILGLLSLTLPVFMVYRSGSPIEILLAEVVFIMTSSIFMAPSSAYLNSLFPAECRFSGIALGTCLGTAIFGGTTPLICAQLAMTLDPFWGPSLYFMGTACIAFMALQAFEAPSKMKIRGEGSIFERERRENKG